MGRPATNKKERLVEAAVTCFHRQGVASSSLAAIAAEAGVPAGNVFYYFQSKDALAGAVVDRWCARVERALADVPDALDPLDRVRAFVASARDRRQSYADYGCPLAALQTGLASAPAPLAARSGRPIAIMRDWIAGQLMLAGRPRAGARRQADFALAALQGSYQLAHALRDPDIVGSTVDRLLLTIGD